MKFRMLLSALLLAAGLVCVAGCGKKGDSNKGKETEKANQQADPQSEAAAAFWNAMFVKCDAEAAKKLTVYEDSKAELENWIERFQKLKKMPEYAGYADMIAHAQVGDVTVEDDTAVVAMVFTCEKDDRKMKKGESFTDKRAVTLEKVGGKWLVKEFHVDL